METLLTPNAYYREQQQIAAATVAGAGKLWRRVTDDFRSFEDVRRPMLELVQVGRLAAATSSVEYTPKVLAETNQVAVPAGFIAPAAFVRSAPDGRDMGSLLDEAPIQARMAVARGATAHEARALAGTWLTGMLLTVMADTGRSVVGADIAQRPTLQGYVRMLNPPSCSRCVILAGKWFRWNKGFDRHPRCDCRHIPAAESMAGDLTTDPYAYFDSLSKEAQEKAFGRIESRAIRDGADIYRVENIKLRGLATAKGNLRYGTPSRITIDDIYRTAGTRTNAIKMMTQEGFITGPQVAGGNVLGVREGFGALGKGGAAKAAREAVVTARVGVRDPLNRYTMTAAERRLYDAQYRLTEARATGMWPRSVGANSADKYTRPTPLTPGDLATLEKAFANEVARLQGDPVRGIRPAPSSVQNLARLLGIS